MSDDEIDRQVCELKRMIDAVRLRYMASFEAEVEPLVRVLLSLEKMRTTIVFQPEVSK